MSLRLMVGDYVVNLTPDLAEGGYTVTVPALPGCITEGDTLDEAIANAREAIALHVAEWEGENPRPERA